MSSIYNEINLWDEFKLNGILIKPPYKSCVTSSFDTINTQNEITETDVLLFGGLLADDHSRFVEILNANPWLVFIDSVVQYAIIILYINCSSGADEIANRSRRTLQESGLNLFVPKGMPKHTRKDQIIKLWEKKPEVFLRNLKGYLDKITKHYKPPYKRDDMFKKVEDIEKAFYDTFQLELPEKMRNEFMTKDYGKDGSQISLRFLWYYYKSHGYKLPYEALRDLLKKIPKELKNKYL